MWIFSKCGFFSVVEDQYNNKNVKIRARLSEDIKELEALYKSTIGKETKIIKDVTADYLYRIIIPKAEWAEIAKVLTNEIDYTNFKSRMHDKNNHKLDKALAEIWQTMYSLQK